MNYSTEDELREKIGRGWGAVAVKETSGLRIHGNIQRLDFSGRHSLNCYMIAAKLANRGKNVLLVTNE